MSDPHAPESDERPNEAATLREKARTGIVALLARAAILEVVTLVGAVFIARALGPAEFGLFGLVRFALQFFRLFGDVGLGAALVRQKEAPTAEQLSSIFWVQLGLGSIVVGVVWVLAPAIVANVWPGMPPVGVWVMRALAFELLLTMLRTIPSLLLERDLAYRELSVIDVVNGVAFYLVAVPAALFGLGAKALVLGVLAQGIVAAIVAQLLRPFWPSTGLRWSAVKPLMGFGLAFQINTLIGFLNAAVMPLAAGAALGAYVFGVVSWSQTTAYFPLSLLGIVGRVNFPLLSRMQDDRRGFTEAVERSVALGAVVIYFFMALFVGLGLPFVQIIYGAKWIPAVPTLCVFAIALGIGYLVVVVAGAFDALGKPGTFTKLSLFWTAVNWISVLGTLHYRKTAMAFALAFTVHMLVGNVATIWALRLDLPGLKVYRSLAGPALATVAVTPLGYYLIAPRMQGPVTLVLGIAALLVAYFAVLAVTGRETAMAFFATFRKQAPAPASPPESAPPV